MEECLGRLVCDLSEYTIEMLSFSMEILILKDPKISGEVL